MDHQLHADDSQAYIAFKPIDEAGISEVVNRVEKCVGDMRMEQNYLKVNDDKTEIVLFTPKHKPLNPISVRVGDAVIQPVHHVQNFGAMLDSHMSMEKQVNSVCRSAYNQLRNISRIRHHLTESATRTLVQALVTSRLDYCNSLLYGVPLRLINKLQRAQNSAARIIGRVPRRQHITPVLRDLHWLPIAYRVRYKILTLTFRALQGEAPSYITDLIQEKKQVRALRSQSALTLDVPRTRTARYGDRAFYSAAPVLWNALPVRIRSCDTLDSFKKTLKTHLFCQAFP